MIALGLTAALVLSPALQDGAPPTGDAEAGQALFSNNCTGCHGPDTLHVETKEDLNDVLAQGASHPMAGMFDEKAIGDLYAYIREASGR